MKVEGEIVMLFIETSQVTEEREWPMDSSALEGGLTLRMTSIDIVGGVLKVQIGQRILFFEQKLRGVWMNALQQTTCCVFFCICRFCFSTLVFTFGTLL